MTSVENISLRAMRRRLLKLTKVQLIRHCKEYRVSHIGTKNEMSLRIIQKLESKRKKKKLSKTKKRKKQKKNRRKEKQLSLVLFESTPSTNSYSSFIESARKYHQNVIHSSLASRGYKQTEKLSSTLQGNIFVAYKTFFHIDCVLIYGYFRQIILKYQMNDNHKALIQICYMYFKQDIVIKSANKCYYKSLSQSTNSENIINESHLMSIFEQNNAPKSMIKYIDFFCDDKNYYLVMEKGGSDDLFEFNKTAHQLLQCGKLDLFEWQKTVQNIFCKMVKFIHWLHDEMHCCHLDISLENVIMSNSTYFDEKSGTFRNVDIKFIDFGLAEMFDENFLCRKYAIGKLGYKAPKAYSKCAFMANKADIYSLGICLFLLSIGAPPYNRPAGSDQRFKMLKDGKMCQLLKCWNRLHYIEEDALHLLIGLLCIDEEKRVSIEEILSHKWLKSVGTPCIVESNTSTFELCQNCEDFAAVENK